MRAALFLAVLFAVPIVPFLVLGASFEESLLLALKEPAAPGVICAWVAGLLAVDIFLPVPSSAIITYAGGVLGVGWATVVAWAGLSVGAAAGFGLARKFGAAVARRFSEPGDVERLSSFAERHGVAALVLTRALPILAETCVLFLGTGRMTWRRFLPAMLVSNGLLALVYASCGAYFRESAGFPVAIVVSGALPLVVALVLRKYWRGAANGQKG